jgi:ABC-type nitrate/sulfonate/bicarbonate transport system substrate-binding protein
MPSERAERTTLRRIRLVVFPGGFNWPLWVAQAKGLFARHGVEVEITPTPGSVFQLTGLIEGRFDLAITLVDNIVAYREGQGEVPLAGPELIAVMASDTRVYPALVTLPEVRSYADLRGRTLSVDALTTGYAIVLLAMLEHGGLAPGDYTLDSVGGAQQRYLAMAERKHAGCLLNSPFEQMLAARGFNILDTAIAVLGRYQGQVVATRSLWADANRGALVGFIRAFLAAVAWLYEPLNRDQALEIFLRNAAGESRESAATAYGILFDRSHGFPRDGAIDPEALAKVIELRSRYGRPRTPLGGPLDYYDPSFLVEANRGL